ncbi:MAG TPA: hypothetical protein VNZ45_00040, partial [Bacteroidia bacterium]|nr:hypothetical protein [Bacteroidia bacterium]
MKIKKIIFLLIAIIFLSGERNLNAQTATFNYVSTATQTWAVPCGVTSATVQVWSAGGAGGTWNNTPGYIFAGGSGSYYTGVFTGLTGGSTVLTLSVPSGGLESITSVGGLGGWPGGAQGGNDITYGEYGGGG